MHIKAILQPSGGSTIELLRECVKNSELTRLDIAVAYITTGGLREFDNSLKDELGEGWGKIIKRWITSFDYMRTEAARSRTDAAYHASSRGQGAEVPSLGSCRGIPLQPPS